ncbi:alpha/beta hydrolase [Aquimarina litoralis]|uniref:alpha/beta hydrolase n=1 Tax=Aquimarina litoralis TaxID=584605 RepID=UPI001C59DF0B|nr:alpha/beta fold hydrolase [Aquimarina litoralis]MBW1298294.1 alpha/beta fold hydrolase [Aquimarina litoralis]
MKKLLKFAKAFALLLFLVLLGSILYVRFSRYTDTLIYHVNGLAYEHFESNIPHKEYYFEVDTNTTLHGVLFKPKDEPIGTIIHHAGKGMHLMSSQPYYKLLTDRGFQVFGYERRDFGKSTGIADNSLILKEDVLFMFDTILKDDAVQGTPIVIWGQSLGGAFAMMNAAERNDKIAGVIVEGTFNSFPDIGKEYARAINMGNFKWMMPILMNNDFPAEKEIQKINKPILVIHSNTDEQVPFKLGKRLYKASDTLQSTFWEIQGKHIAALFDYKEEYLKHFEKMID